jgi:hypothetical protein
VRNPFSSSQAQQPFLSPLGRQRRLPAVAAPALLTLGGGVALVVVFGATLFGLQQSGIFSAAAEPEATEALAEVPHQPRIVTIEEKREGPAEEELALVTALPQAPVSDAGEFVLEPVAAREEAQEEAGDGADHASTAAIPPALPAEITAFAPQPRPEPSAEETTGGASAAVAAVAAAAGNASMRAAVVTRAVNMRAAPNGRAQVLTVVPGSSEIRAETDCSWCEIDYQGRSGFIYKSFITYR